jgi:hypothetical protein
MVFIRLERPYRRSRRHKNYKGWCRVLKLISVRLCEQLNGNEEDTREKTAMTKNKYAGKQNTDPIALKRELNAIFASFYITLSSQIKLPEYSVQHLKHVHMSHSSLPIFHSVTFHLNTAQKT